MRVLFTLKLNSLPKAPIEYNKTVLPLRFI